MPSREDRIKVFENTRQLYTSNQILKDSIKLSIKGQQVISGCETINDSRIEQKYSSPARVIVSKKRSLEAAQVYRGKKVCVHNFASATNPGGGVTKGSSAQEECLCRCSTLYPCISDYAVQPLFYKKHKAMLQNGKMNALYNNDCIYTPGVTVFKSDKDAPTLLSDDQWYNIDIISCAAPNLRERPSNSMNPESGDTTVKVTQVELKDLHTKRMNRILDIAKANNAEVIILGAFGCGAFQNPPKVVARGMYEAVKRHLYDFETIEFAVYCTPRDMSNYEVFNRVFKNIKL